jgi:hypothetical protein
MLTDVVIPPSGEYRTGSEHEPIAFYMDALLESTRMDLLLGYFSSSAISVLAIGFAKFLSNGGRVRMVINHILSQQDKDAVLATRILTAKQSDPQADTSALEAEVDGLYGLGEEEIEIVKFSELEDTPYY